MAAHIVPVTADAEVLGAGSGPRTLMGWSIAETGATNAGDFRIRQTDGSGAVLASVKIPASGSSQVWFGPQGIAVHGAIYFDLVGTGTVEGSIFVA